MRVPEINLYRAGRAGSNPPGWDAEIICSRLCALCSLVRAVSHTICSKNHRHAFKHVKHNLSHKSLQSGRFCHGPIRRCQPPLPVLQGKATTSVHTDVALIQLWHRLRTLRTAAWAIPRGVKHDEA